MSWIPHGIRRSRVGVKETTVEEMLLNVVGVKEAKLGVITKSIVDLGRATDGIGAGYVFVDVFEDVLGVPNNKFETFPGRALADEIPIVLRPIIITDPMIDDHVVDEIVEVDVLLELLVVGTVGEARIREGEHGIPCFEIAGDNLGPERRILDDVVIGAVAAEIAGGEVFVGPLVDIMEAPVEAVEVNVIELAVE